MREEQRRLADTISHLRALFWRLPPQSSRWRWCCPSRPGSALATVRTPRQL